MVEKWLMERFVAHRGLHTDTIPENTLAAFENAISHRFNIELDVQLTADNVPVVFHDINMKRLTGTDCAVGDLTLAELKRNVRYIGFPDHEIPTFAEALACCNGRAGIMIEVKKPDYFTTRLDSEYLLADMLRDYGGQFIVKSFNPFTMDWFSRHTPQFVLGLLCEVDSMDEYPEEARRLADALLFGSGRGVDFFDYCASKLGSEIYQSVKKTEKPIFVWTIHSQAFYEAHKSEFDNMIFEGFIPAARPIEPAFSAVI